MTVPSQQATPYPATAAPEFPRHIVTAVLVAHDGARWLPKALSALLGQDRPVQGVIAADTGSADDSARLLAEVLGRERVVYLARRTGFGTAVGEAASAAEPVLPEQLPYLSRPQRTPGGWDPATRTWTDTDGYEQGDGDGGGALDAEPVQWLWLLHDDCEPQPDALRELLRVADASPSAAVVGPKLRSWYDRRQLLETGVTIARSGRRWTGIERREQDQGQHDQVRTVLAVSSAGMLVRRDVWDQLGGFDRHIPLMRDDVDFCWRVHSAGHRVLVAPGAVLRHAEAAARERRPIDAARPSPARPHRVDKAGAVYTLLVNTRGRMLPYVALRLVIGTLLRTVGYLVAKAPGLALDEFFGLLGVALRPHRFLAGRRRRAQAVADPAELRPLFPPPGATVRLAVEQLASNFTGRADPDSGSARHGAVESGPTDEDSDFLEVENFARLKRIASKPAPVLFASLLLVSLVACRDLFGSGSLSGGALLPAPDGAFDLWSRIGTSWHPVGIGSTEAAPPYLAVVAALATVLFSSTQLAITALLVASVPLAGLTAYFAARPLTASQRLRAWASIAYALLPAATGALAAARLGTAVLAMLLPLLARAGIAATGLVRHATPSWRSVWATALLLTIVTAFTPVMWPIAAVLLVAAAAVRARSGAGGLAQLAGRFAVLLGTPMVLLAPWSLGLFSSPSRFLAEAGLKYSDGASAGALDLLLLNPGGPGTVAAPLLVGILLAGLAALLRSGRRLAISVAWAAALVGAAFAVASNGAEVAGSGGGTGLTWPGPALLVYGIGLLAAAVVGAEGARGRVTAMSFGWRQPVALLIAAAAALAPLASAAGWVLRGAGNPLSLRDPVQVPAFVAEEGATRDQARTLVLSEDSPARISYALVRGSGARLGDADIAARTSGANLLDGVVANLLAGSGGDQAGALANYAVHYVMLKGSTSRDVSRTLDSTPGLSRLSREGGTALWRVEAPVARLTMVSPDGSGSTPVASGPVGAVTSIPSGASGRTLRLADAADSGWQATLDGKPLKPTTVDSWAQGFELPAAGGKLVLTYQDTITHTLWVWAQRFLAVVVLVLALPGRRRQVDDDLPDEPAPGQRAQAGPAGEGRRARRLRAAAGTTATATPAEPGAAEPELAEPEPEPVEPEPEPQPAAAAPSPDYPAPDQAGYQQYPQYEGYQEAGYPAGPAQPESYDWDAFGAGVPEQYPAEAYPPGQYPAEPYPGNFAGYPPDQYSPQPQPPQQYSDPADGQGWRGGSDWPDDTYGSGGER